MAQQLILAAVLAAVALLASSAAGQDYPRLACDSTAGSFTPSSRYLANINTIGAALPKNASASPDLFATVVVGAVPDKVWALSLCRGDANATYCLGCLAQAFRDLPNSCAYNKDAAIYYDKCMLGYSSTGFGFPAVDVDDSGTTYESPNYEDITLEETPRFNRFRAVLMNATADYAAYNSSTRRYAAGEADMDLPDYPKLYSWAQCTPTPDLTPARCRRCLAGAISKLYSNSSVGMVLGVRCSIRYQTDSFMDGPVMVRQALAPSTKSAAPAPTPKSAGALAPAAAGGAGRKYSVPGLVLIVALPILAAINLITLLCFWRRSPPTKTKRSGPDYNKEAEDMEIVDSMVMDISTLRAATGDFGESNKLGEGEFGAVYKGVLPDGDEIAVKRMPKSSSSLGVDELTNELAVVAKLKHKNLASLVGVCLEQQERLLVFEFLPNKSLNLVIFDTEKRKRLEWGKRYNIIDGIARGLQYLHEDSQLNVVHGDLKASNILLDTNMSPKISDFGLARIFSREQTHARASSGTYGYIAPEYRMRGHYSAKSDAFSFGVMVLEIVTGRSNKYCSDSQQSEDLLISMWEHWMAGTVLEMVDPAMNGCFSEDEVRRCIHVGLLCVQENPGDRPVMSSVVMTLGSDTVSLQAPAKPASFASNGGAKPGAASV